MDWIKKALSEPDGTPSSQRLVLLVLLVFTLDIIACAMFFGGGKLPDIPASLSDLLKWLFTAAIAGVGFGKATSAAVSFAQKGADNATSTDTATSA